MGVKGRVTAAETAAAALRCIFREGKGEKFLFLFFCGEGWGQLPQSDDPPSHNLTFARSLKKMNRWTKHQIKNKHGVAGGKKKKLV